MSAAERTGRRRGRHDTRSTIAEAANACFTQAGYDGTTMRDIASAAHVDPALIHHYFKTKRALFDETLGLPEPGDSAIIAALASANPGEALILAFLGQWDAPSSGSSFARLIRTAATESATQTRLTEMIGSTLIAPSAAAVEPRTGLPKLRATLVAAQLAGVAWLRYVLRVEPIASASPQLLARTFGPSIATTLGRPDPTAS